ncbi:MAG: hypothetical protein BWY26_01245 [Elusimicrobia bacterium ADurb.Bin231]|nr:MAG: hypothetical protein BWY26_01245 [Elusimicrobia bacterium ADurb.Bin231]
MITGKKAAQKLLEEWDEIWKEVDPGQNKGRQRSVFGSIFEDLVTDFLKSESEELKVKKGLIRGADLGLSPQVDIIIYSNKVKGIYEKESYPTAIVDYKDVKSIIEVKSFVDLPTLNRLPSQIDKIKEFCPTAKTCIFIGTLATPIDEQQVRSKFNFVDYFAILYTKQNKVEINDYGEGLDKFISYLSSLS